MPYPVTVLVTLGFGINTVSSANWMDEPELNDIVLIALFLIPKFSLWNISYKVCL
jgi:hypothetical protein